MKADSPLHMINRAFDRAESQANSLLNARIGKSFTKLSEVFPISSEQKQCADCGHGADCSSICKDCPK